MATVDFFTPIVDDPATWGAIAAANALSDVYAMGGRPLFGLNLVGWPRETLPFDLLGDVLAGAARVARQAGCLVVGGHSVDDREPKFGMAVIGEVHPDRMLTNARAQAGDLLLLTKPLGTGILTTALKQDRLDEAALAPAVASMVTLNAAAAEVALAVGAHAATDITGFGLIGHLSNVLHASGTGALLAVEAFPLFAGVRDLAAAGVVPGGTKRNLEAVAVAWDDDVSPADRLIAADAQTSGGLLLAVSPDRAEEALVRLQEAGTPAAAVIGRVTAERSLRVTRRL